MIIGRLAKDLYEGEKVCISGSSLTILALVFIPQILLESHRWPFSVLTSPMGPSLLPILSPAVRWLSHRNEPLD